VSDEDVRTEFAKAIAEAARVGRWEDVRRLTDALLRVVGAHAIDIDRTFVNVQGQDVTKKQRGRRIAEGHAKGDPRLRALGKKYGSAANAADKLFGVARSTLSQWMSGKVPPPDDARRKAAQAFPDIDLFTPPTKD
jgi:hypothetical protein